MSNQPVRPLLVIPCDDLFSEMCHLGLFATGASVWAVLQIILAIQTLPCCIAPKAPAYFHTLPSLLWSALFFGVAVGMQALYLCTKYVPVKEIPRFRLLGFFLGHAALHSLPFLLIWVTQFALFTAMPYYLLLAAVTWWGVQRVAPQLGAYRLAFQKPLVILRMTAGQWGQAGLAVCSVFILFAMLGIACACSVYHTSSLVRYNLSLFQNMLELYAEEQNGIYPSSVAVFKKEVWLEKTGYYPRELCGNTELIQAVEKAHLLRSRDILGFRFDLERGRSNCMVLYRRISPTRYELTATDENGRLMTRYGRPFTQEELR